MVLIISENAVACSCAEFLEM